MTFADAAKTQYRHRSFYIVLLTGPHGYREELGYTARKSGTALLKWLYSDDVHVKVLRHVPSGTSIKKTANALIFGETGYRLEFGGTIRQEATE